MALEEEPHCAGQEMRRALSCLQECAGLAQVDPATLATLAAAAVHFSLPAGHTLFERGSPSSGVYLLVSGRLRVLPGSGPTDVISGELVGESSWLLGEPHGQSLLALRDCEMLLLPAEVLGSATQESATLSLALAAACARKLQRSNGAARTAPRARVFTLLPAEDVDVADFATRLAAELEELGRTELVWEMRARTHTSAWFHRIEERNEVVLYVADPGDSGWTRQCCRQADVVVLVARARAPVSAFPHGVAAAALARGIRVELILLHEGGLAAGVAARWLGAVTASAHHHVLDDSDLGRVARLLTGRGVGLVLSGGGARGFAHIGVIRALREAGVPIDSIGGASIGSIIAAGAAAGWEDAEMLMRYRRSFVDTNPVNDYTFPMVALTRGRKVTRLLAREYGDVHIEDLRQPFFCVSANLTTGRVFEHRRGPLVGALRAAVAIPGVMPPVDLDGAVLVDGATINNLPIDIMRRSAPGFVVGSDVGAERAQAGPRRLNILQILMYAGLVNSAASSAAQRSLADVVLRPPLGNVDLLDWRAFERAIESGYRHARRVLEEMPEVPRLTARSATPRASSSLDAEIARRAAMMREREG